MKKSLLSLLVVALTIVGCQNYDDQFDDLNNKITSLASQVGELSGLSAAVQAVGDRVTALESATCSDVSKSRNFQYAIFYLQDDVEEPP